MLTDYVWDDKVVDERWSLFMKKAVRGDIAGVGAMLEAGADPNEFVSMGDEAGNTVLMEVITTGNDNMVGLLLEHGATANLPHRDLGATPFYVAAGYAQIGIMRLLKEKKVHLFEPNIYRQTSMHVAASYGHLDVVLYLLRWGANLTDEDKWGTTALQEARRVKNCHDHLNKPVIDLLESVESAGSWREYIALERLPYCMIRTVVTRDLMHQSLENANSEYCALHFLFGSAPDDIFGRIVGSLIG